MEDYKFIIYILLAVAYLLFSNWRKFIKGIDDPAQPKKFRDPAAAPEQPRPKPQQPATPVTSFDDILRELQPKAERAREEVLATVETVKVEQEKVVGKYRNYDTEYAAKAYTDERLAEARAISKRTQEARRSEAFVPYAKDKPEKSKRLALEMLRNPTTAREAFILSEIFQRKY
jgi:hypothetical protein